MLNLFVRLMKRYLALLPFLFLLLAAQDSPTVAISSPGPGEVLRGQVNIIGTTSDPNFISAELEFAYASTRTETWFPIQTISQPVFDSPLHTWDTTVITDGNYILRLRVYLNDGTFQEVTVPVTLQNDVQPATPTPAPTATPEEEMLPVPTPFLLASSPTPTDLPRAHADAASHKPGFAGSDHRLIQPWTRRTGHPRHVRPRRPPPPHPPLLNLTPDTQTPGT